MFNDELYVRFRVWLESAFRLAGELEGLEEYIFLMEEVRQIWVALWQRGFDGYYAANQSSVDNLLVWCGTLYQQLYHQMNTGSAACSPKAPIHASPVFPCVLQSAAVSTQKMETELTVCRLQAGTVTMTFNHAHTVDELFAAINGTPSHIVKAKRSNRDAAWNSRGITFVQVKNPEKRVTRPRLTDEEVSIICHAYSVSQPEYDFQLIRGSGCMSARFQQLVESAGNRTIFCEQWFYHSEILKQWQRATPAVLLNHLSELLPADLVQLFLWIAEHHSLGLGYPLTTSDLKLLAYLMRALTSLKPHNIYLNLAVTPCCFVNFLTGQSCPITFQSILSVFTALLTREDQVARLAIAIVKCVLGHVDMKYYTEGESPVNLNDASRWRYTFTGQISRALNRLLIRQFRRPDVVVLDIAKGKETVREVLDCKFVTKYEGEGDEFGEGNSKEQRDTFRLEQFQDFKAINSGDPPIEITFETTLLESIDIQIGVAAAGRGTSCCHCRFGTGAASQPASLFLPPPAFADGGPGLLTGGGQMTASIHRVPCLAQVRNSCGQRAAHNALAFLRTGGNLANATTAMANNHNLRALGPMALDIDDNTVRNMLDNNGGGNVALVSTLLHVRNFVGNVAFVADLGGDTALCNFALGTSNRVQVVINTLANSVVVPSASAPSVSPANVGHYIAVELERSPAGGISVAFADSLMFGGDRTDLIQSLLEALRPGSQPVPALGFDLAQNRQ